MRNYPRNIATKQDFINLLAMPEYKEKAEKELKALHELQDDFVERVVSSKIDVKGQMTDVVTETIPNSSLMYKRMGFESKEEIGMYLDLKNSVD